MPSIKSSRVSLEPPRQLLRRYYCDFDGYCYRTSWDVWGRWVASAVIVITIALLAFLFSAQRNRRRRNNGLKPMYGTGWIPGSKLQPQNGQNQYPQYNQQMDNMPAPPYAPTGTPFTGQQQNPTTYNHTGQHANDVELQQPASSYQPPRVESVYEPPPGPPPGKSEKY